MNDSLVGHEHGETSQEEIYPSFERNPGPPVKEPNVSDRVEITQQQVSRTTALALFAGFLLFLAGYTMGKYQVIGNLSGTSELIPSLVYSMFFDSTEAVVQGLDTSTQSAGYYARFATREEADKLCMNLKKRGEAATVVLQSSFTASGKEFVQYQVVVPCQTEVHRDAEQVQKSSAAAANEVVEDKDESESSDKKTMKKG